MPTPADASSGSRAVARLRLFGAPQVEFAAAAVGSVGSVGGNDGADHGHVASQALAFERRYQLVAWLALKRGWIGRPELAALLWPEIESRLALANLRKALHRLQVAPFAAVLQASGQALRFAVETDVQAFEAALAAARLPDALALYRGELLAGFDDAANSAWTERLRFERERLHAAWRSAALQRLAQPDFVAGGGAEALAARVVAADPLDEAAVAAQMHVLAQRGQVSAARAAFRAYGERLVDELGIAPGAALKAQHEALHAAAAAQTGAGAGTAPHHASAPSALSTPSALSAAPLPGAASSTPPDDGFVGRNIELQRIAELLAQDDCALLALVGPGGVGKTRLAQRSMQLLAPRFADGAAFVPLEDVPTSAGIGAHLAGMLGIALVGREAAFDEVRRALAPRRLLLVLDNFEHLVEDCAWLDALRRDAPLLKVLVTSRVRPLALSVWTLPLEGLPCPGDEDEDRLEAFDAARLFVRAARRVEPALVPATEAAAIVDICRQVEGLPLALELAASFTRVLSCEAIAAELRAGTELLRAADPARPARQASLEAVFEQSWRHLAETERRALARLAVLRGGFTATSARQVGGASLPVLAALADKSLLRKEGARCHLHPLVQQFALERLDGGAPEGPQWRTVAAQHAEHFLRWLAQKRPAIRHAEPRAMQEVDAEFENVRSAWRFALHHGPADMLAAAGYSVMAYCDHRARRAEGLALMHEALAGETAQAAEDTQAPLLGSAAQLLLRLDRYAEAETSALRALAIAERHDDLTTRQQCTTVLGAATARLGRLDDASRWFERTLRLAEKAGDATHRASAYDNLALVERLRGRLERSLALNRQGLQLHREIGDAGGEAQCLNNLGVAHILRGELEPAREVLLEARRVCERHGLAVVRSQVEINLAQLAIRAHDGDTARQHARQALEIGEATRQRAFIVEARQALCMVAIERGELALARDELRAAVEAALPLRRPSMLVHLARLFAQLLGAQGEPAAAALVMGFVLQQQSGLVGAERIDAEQRLREWGGTPGALPVWSGPPLQMLAERVVAEAPSAYASLLAELRGKA